MKILSNLSTHGLRARHLLLAAALATSVAASAIAPPDDVIDVVQPDGSVLPVMARGSHRHHRIFSVDGLPLIYGADGMLQYAVAGPDGIPVASGVKASVPSMRSAAEIRLINSIDRALLDSQFNAMAASAATPRKGAPSAALADDDDAPTSSLTQRYLCKGAAFPAEGEPHALVVLVQFQDKKFTSLNPAGFYERLLNEEGFSDYQATGSARDFFVENSDGIFKPVFDLFGPVTLDHGMAYYGANDWAGNDLCPEEMVIEACRQLDPDVDFSIYDTNGDGQIDNVFIFYAGYGEADSMQANTVWPHSADILDFNLGEDYYFDGLLLNRYAMTCELDYRYKRTDGIGTFVHEFSHVLGLPDLYATSYTTAYTPGFYSTLDMGPYNNQGRTPPHFSSFERYCLGWLEPAPLSEGEHSLRPLHLSNDCFIIPTARDDEFFLIENRQQLCCDAYLPGHGMLVWHVDYDKKIWDQNIVNNSATHQYVDLIEADGVLSTASNSGDPFPGPYQRTELSHTSNPALVGWDNKPLAFGLHSIAESEDGIITFTAKSQAGSGVEEIAAAASPFRIEGNRIVNTSDCEISLIDAAGRKAATLLPGESTAPAQGIYIIYGPDFAPLKTKI